MTSKPAAGILSERSGKLFGAFGGFVRKAEQVVMVLLCFEGPIIKERTVHDVGEESLAYSSNPPLLPLRSMTRSGVPFSSRETNVSFKNSRNRGLALSGSSPNTRIVKTAVVPLKDIS